MAANTRAPDINIAAAPVNPVTAADRLGFTLFLSIALHATLIIGLGFGFHEPTPAPSTLEVTLAYHRSDKAPEKADFIAQANQQGSGTAKKKLEMTTDTPADFDSNRINDVQPIQQATRKPTNPDTPTLVITTSGLSDRQSPQKQKDKQPPNPLKQADQDHMQRLSQEIASLQARLDAERQAYAHRPKIKVLDSVSTKTHYEALYMDAFRREVEDMGTRHFPRQALSQHKFGSVRLLVRLKPDGTVLGLKVLKSSGYGFLDQAALQSVRLAAPFAPFTPEMRKHIDILEIIRTWKFDASQVLTTHY